jgi:glycosyltransferase involved in cell wall biosynthesis
MLRDRFARFVLKRVDAVVSGHPDWQVNLPIQPRNFVHIPSIVEDDFFSISRQPDSGLVLFAGGPRAIKGWPVLAAAWPMVKAAIPHARLVATGWPDLQRRIKAPPLGGSVDFKETLPARELAHLMAEASVLTIPSLYEVAPLILTEAWALELPVVASAVGGIPGLASGAALLVPPERPSKLADGLISALRGDAGIGELVAEGRRRSEKHARAVVAADHVALYNELLRENHG